MLRKLLKSVVAILTIGCLGLVGYIYVAPPDLLRVGTNYSAKIVCSNVFIAGRNADEVLRIDVQAPGHPLLKYVSATVDQDSKTVHTLLFGAFAKAQSQYRPGLGCSNIHNTQLSDNTLATLAELPAELWPVGNLIAPSQNPGIAGILSDPDLLGQGYRAVVVVKNGRIVGESYAKGFDETTPLLGWSMTKTVTAGLIGTLIQSGQMDLDRDLVTTFKSWSNDSRSNISLSDMLAMASGLAWNEGYGSVSDVTRMLYLENDMAGFASAKPAESAANSNFNYSSGTSTMLSRVWQDVVGHESLSYPQQALFTPLGMTSAVMETDANDTFVGSSYMYASARDWARYGQFLLQGGIWEGVELLPAGFTDWMFEDVAVSEGQYAKGHLWRDAPGGGARQDGVVWLSGHDGQSIGIFPKQNMVVVRLGLTPSSMGYSPSPLAQSLIKVLDG